MNYKIVINGSEIELFSDQIIGLTLQAENFSGDAVLKRTMDFTNQIDVPKTSHNVSALGQSSILKANTSFPFTKNRAQIFANGMRIMTGFAIIEKIDTVISLQFFSNAIDLKEKIGEKVLSALDFQDSPITWNQAFMDSSRNGLGPFISPVINYGQIDGTIANGEIGDYYLPSVLYSSIINAIFYTAGYGWGPGDFYTDDPFFKYMALTYSRKDWPGTSFKANEVLSDEIKQIDFLYDFQVKFNLYFRFNMGYATFFYEPVSLNDVLADHAGAIDWTEKRANKFEEISFAFGSWAQNNWFRYPNKNHSGSLPDGALTFNNENVDTNNDVYTSITEAATGIVQWRIASVLYGAQAVNFATLPNPVYETVPSSFTFDNDPRPVLIICRPADVSEAASIKYDGNVRTDYWVGYFENNNSTYEEHDGLRWSTSENGGRGLLELYYPRLQRCLLNPKKVIREYMLSVADINSFDIYTLIYDDGNYFLPLKIIDFVAGRPTRVEMMLVTTDETITSTTTTTTTTTSTTTTTTIPPDCKQYQVDNPTAGDLLGSYVDCDGNSQPISLAPSGTTTFCAWEDSISIESGGVITLLGDCP